MGEVNGLKWAPRRTCRGLALVGLMSLLSACAARVPPAAQTTGQLHLGTVVSVRPARFDGNDRAAQKILALLNVPAPAAAPAVELVIRQPDQSVISIVQPAGPGQPDFVSGEHVLIVEAANTVVRPR
jgi:outer membrane lipoprotein SlyB